LPVRLIRVLAVALALCALAPPGRTAWATPTEKLDEARDAFNAGDYERAIPLFNYLLYPDVRLADKDDIVEAHVFLGAAYFETGSVDDARRELEDALRLDENVEMLDIIFSPEAIRFFTQVRAVFLERARQMQARKELADAEELLRQRLKDMIVIERRPYFINFVPFGAGQFNNKQNKKGVLALASQGAICGTSATLWSIQVAKYGFNGKVPRDEVNAVRTMQKWQIAAGVACFVLMGAGVADALINYQSETRLPADESLLPENLSPKKRAARERMPVRITPQLTPIASPDGAGVALSWEF
jgi:tetratricopeptide (TPR) repeat protein